MDLMLSVVIVTQNRAKKLEAAIRSCIASDLPEKTEFIVIDNASEDNTEQVIESLSSEIGYPIIYKRNQQNIGCAPARNIGFELASGKYLYFMDDDLLLTEKVADRIFTECLSYLERNESVSILTTEIFDKSYNGLRSVKTASKKTDGLNEALLFHGGTHFMRRSDFSAPLYPNIFFGGEEWYLAMKTRDDGKRVVCNKEIVTYHDSDMKISQTDSEYKKRTQIGVAHAYAVKKKLYPAVFYPIIWAFFILHALKYSRSLSELKVILKLKKELCEKAGNQKKVKTSTVITAAKEYGLMVFV